MLQMRTFPGVPQYGPGAPSSGSDGARLAAAGSSGWGGGWGGGVGGRSGGGLPTRGL